MLASYPFLSPTHQLLLPSPQVAPAIETFQALARFVEGQGDLRFWPFLALEGLGEAFSSLLSIQCGIAPRIVHVPPVSAWPLDQLPGSKVIIICFPWSRGWLLRMGTLGLEILPQA